MPELRFVLQVKSPLLFPQSGGDPNSVSTLDYIPGTALLGAFVQRYIAQRKLGRKAHQDPDFKRLFLSHDVTFSPAYIAHKNKYNVFTAFYPTPMSIQARKNNENNICDLLIEPKDEAFKALGGYISISGGEKCMVLKQMLYHQVRPLQNSKRKPQDYQELRYQEDPIPFTYESILPNQYFHGHIHGSQNDLESLQQLIPQGSVIRLGRSRQVHYGEVTIDWASQFEAAGFGPLELDEGIAMTLLSDTLIYNDVGMATVDLDALQKYLPQGVTLNPSKIFVRKRIQEQYVAIWQHRRPAEVSLQAGSCFWLNYSGDEDSIKDALQALQTRGLGERLAEGFGQVVFGWQTSENDYRFTAPDINRKTPKTPIPALTQTIVAVYYKQQCLQKTALLAMQNANELKRLPAKSLLGRLEQTLRNEKMDDFRSMVKDLKLTATKQLEKCHKDKTLLELLQQDICHTPAWENAINKLRTPFQDKGVPLPELDSEQMNKHYFLTLLSRLRKLKSEGEKP